VESTIRRFNDPDIKWSTQGMMRLTPDAMKRLFHPTVEKIKNAIGDVLNSPDVKGKWMIMTLNKTKICYAFL
jgi:hypothetical protein